MDETWPPRGERAVLLGELAELIERGGAAHFLDAPVVRADQRDFPEKWEPTAAGVERLLARLLWHAHVDLDVDLDDLRQAGDDHTMLRRSEISWVETRDGVAMFQLEAIGNDNLAGLLSHEIGRAYLGWIAASAPYRDEAAQPGEHDGTTAAIYLGLGVLAANAAMYERVATDLIGRTTITERDVIMTGGLPTADIVYLLAVQAVLRAAAIEAHATLRGELRTHVAEAIEALRPHRAALAEHLGLDLDAARPVLARDPAPAEVPDGARPEPDRRTRAAGQRTYRVAHTRLDLRVVVTLLVAGTAFVIGYAAAASFAIAGIAAGVAGVLTIVASIRLWPVVDRCALPICEAVLPPDAVRCPGCGATVSGRLKNPNERLARDEELDEAEGIVADDSHAG